jgi:hypothetical protein
MPHGFFTVEQWRRRRWTPIFHLDSYQSLTAAIAMLEKRGQPGLYRVLQTQRCLWAENEKDKAGGKGKLRVHGCHVSSPKSLAELAKLFEKERGRRPVEKARQDRARAKAKAS